MTQSHVPPALAATLGTLVATAYIVVTGILAVQVDVGRLGVSVDLLNRPTGVLGPVTAWPSLIGLAVVSLLAVMLITRGRVDWGHRSRAAFGFGFAAVLLPVTIYAVFVTGPEFLMRFNRFDMIEGPHSWIDRAGNSSALHLVLAIVFAWSISMWRKGKSAAAKPVSELPSTDASTSVDPDAGYQIN